VRKKSGYTARGRYKIPNLKIDSYSGLHNKPPAGAFAVWRIPIGLGGGVADDIIAAALQMTGRLRKQNGYNEGDKFVTEETLRAVGFERVY